MTKLQEQIQKIPERIGETIIGQPKLINRLLVSLLAEGHLLIEGVPGLAKTLSVKALAHSIDADFKRIQFTPDLLPADLIGTTIYLPKEGSFKVTKGPIFTQFLLADEINRAPAKVQSALLEIMQEKQVTIGKKSHPVKRPFMVFATQNPIEQEGTYPLPEAQTDRFLMKVKVDYPTFEQEKQVLVQSMISNKKIYKEPLMTAEQIESAIIEVDEIFIDPKIIHYILSIVAATRAPNRLIQLGASPRASIGLAKSAKAYAYLKGRDYVSPSDIKELTHDILRHRIRRTYEAEAEEITVDHLIDLILQKIPPP